jgi:hypothetical protein
MKPIEGLYTVHHFFIITVDNLCLLSLHSTQILIDHFCTNLPESQAKSHILETFL